MLFWVDHGSLIRGQSMMVEEIVIVLTRMG